MTTSKKITLSTVKAFIKKNSDNLFINVKSSFDGMTDGCESLYEGFGKVKESKEACMIENTLGIKGAWFVGQSRDYFTTFTSDNFKGIQVSNSCGRFILAIPN